MEIVFDGTLIKIKNLLLCLYSTNKESKARQVYKTTKFIHVHDNNINVCTINVSTLNHTKIEQWDH